MAVCKQPKPPPSPQLVMAEEKWTVVGRRRAAARIRRSQAIIAPPLQAEECDTTRLLVRMKRSIDRVQVSAFFQQFLLQVQSAPVCHLLSRAASTLSSQIPHHLEDAHVIGHGSELLRDGLLCPSADRFGLELGHGNHDASFPMRNSDAGNAVVCSEASLLDASMVQVSECSLNALEAGALTLKALNDTNGSFMNCKCTVGSCRNGPSSDVACNKFSLQEKAECWHLDVLLYGLGSIADSEVSRCQLALILLLKERFSWVGAIEVYDPVLSYSECEMIKELGCLVVALDEKGRRSVVRPTLFYMPHCEDWLYDNVLQANWAPHTLRQIVILGNSFQDYQERWSSLMGRKSARPLHVLQYQQIAKEVPLEATSSSDLPGFNNMSWHFYDLCSTS